MNDKQQPPGRIWLSRFWANYTEHNCQFFYGQRQVNDIEYARVHPSDDARVENIRRQQTLRRADLERFGKNYLVGTITLDDIDYLLSLLPQLSSSEPRLKDGGAGGPVRALLRDVGAIVCVNDPDAGARVEIRVADLKDAQRLHRALAQSRAENSEHRCGKCHHDKGVDKHGVRNARFFAGGEYLPCLCKCDHLVTGVPSTRLRRDPRVNDLLVALRSVRDKAETLEACKETARFAIETYVDARAVEGQ